MRSCSFRRRRRSLHASLSRAGELQEDILEVLLRWAERIRHEACLREEGVERAPTSIWRSGDQGAGAIKPRRLTPRRRAYERKRLLRLIHAHAELAVSTQQVLDRGFRHQPPQVEDGDAGADLTHLAEHVAGDENRLALR